MNRFLILCIINLFLSVCAQSQTIVVCEDETLDLEASLASQLNACGSGSYLEVTSSTVPGVNPGQVFNDYTITGDGALTIEVTNSSNVVCQVLNYNIDFFQASMVLTPVAGSCHQVNIDADANTNATYSFTIEGQTFTDTDGDILPYTFLNGGSQTIELNVSSNLCEASFSTSVIAPGVDAELEFSGDLDGDGTIASDEGLPTITYQGNPNTIVYCTDDDASAFPLTMDGNPLGACATPVYTIEIDGVSVYSAATLPTNLSYSFPSSGFYTVSYQIGCNGNCTSEISYQVFVAIESNAIGASLDPNYSPQTFCIGDQLCFDISIPSANPNDMNYYFVISCGGTEELNSPDNIFIHEFSGIIPGDQFEFCWDISQSSCGCGNDHEFTAMMFFASPCYSAPETDSSEDFKVMLNSDPNFTADPTICINDNETYIWESSVFYDDSENHCEPDLTWTVTELGESTPIATGHDVSFGHTYTSSGQFEVCLEVETECSGVVTAETICEEVCVSDDLAGDAIGISDGSFCLPLDGSGYSISPTFNLDPTKFYCTSPAYQWQVTGIGCQCPTSNSCNEQNGCFTITGETTNNPDITFFDACEFEVHLTITHECGVISLDWIITTQNPPAVSVEPGCSNSCVGAEICLDNCVSIDECGSAVTDIIWTIPGQSGSPFLNPIPADLCFSWSASGTISIEVEAQNSCGTAQNNFDINIEDAPSCSITSPGEICPGSQVNIAPPAGSGSITWYISTDGVDFDILSTGMPHIPTAESTWYYVESTVNGCPCISNTVLVTVPASPVFDIIASSSTFCFGSTTTLSLDPSQSDVTWLNSTQTQSIIAQTIDVITLADTTIFASVTFGNSNNCSITNSITLNIEQSPIVVQCDDLPAIICTNGSTYPIPTFTPIDCSVKIIDSDDLTLFVDPIEIVPSAFTVGEFRIVFEITQNGCPFSDTCVFTISDPVAPVLPPDFSICLNSTFVLDELSGLDGTWSAECNDLIDPFSGLVIPQNSDCELSQPLEMYYEGNCIISDTMLVTILPIPEIDPIANDEVCANDSTQFAATISGNYSEAIWNLFWGPGNTAELAFDEEFVPSDLGITNTTIVQGELVLSTDSDPVCQVTESFQIEVIGLPETSLVMDDVQCIDNPISLPDCGNCDNYSISFLQAGIESFNCNVPGVVCQAPATGIFDYVANLNFGQCSVALEGTLEIIDIPTVSIISLSYDSCEAVASYIVEYTGEYINAEWSTIGNIIDFTPMGNNQFEYIIDHSGIIEVDQVYYDTLFVSNECGQVYSNGQVYHMASPEFTAETDTTYYCSGDELGLIIGFAQPLTVDSIVISYMYEDVEYIDVLYTIPVDTIFYTFFNALDTLNIQFNLTAFNSCDIIEHQSNVAHILAADVSADFELIYDLPLCSGDIIPITINSVGNIQSTEFNSTLPQFDFQYILGTWYLEVLANTPDGAYAIELTENGDCGSDIDVEILELGITLAASFESEDVCIGDTITFFNTSPIPTQETIWHMDVLDLTLTGDTVSYLYDDVGPYNVSMTISDPLFCPSTVSDTVNVNPLPDADFYLDDYFYSVLEPSVEVVSVDEESEDNTWVFNTMDTLNNHSNYPIFNTNQFFMQNFIERYITNEFGCTSRSISTLNFIGDNDIYVPNFFTPNGDGINEYFEAVFAKDNVETYRILIFNRWGDIIYDCTYHQSDPKNCIWIGDVNDGEYYAEDEAYVWLIKDLKYVNREDSYELKGIVIQMR